jgi:hypothetical protein
MSPKTVYIAHPISGDVERNCKKVLDICKEIHSKETVPVVPYLVSLKYLDDSIETDRERGISVNLEYFRRGFIDELWLYGDTISPGMEKEISLAKELGIPTVCKTKATELALRNISSIK